MENKKTIKVNFCDFYSSFNYKKFWATECLVKYYNVEISEQPDFLFYSCFGTKYLDFKNCVKIFVTGENVIPNFNECDYAQGFDYIEFNDRYIRKINTPPQVSMRNRKGCEIDLYNRKFCNFIYSNANSGEGAVSRQEFCKKLMQYKHVDCPGKVMNNMLAEDLEPRNGDWQESKIEFLKKYKFTIAFENSCSNGYTTEKLIQPFQSFSISIYYGNPLVTRDFNPKAFINCNDYDNDFDAIIERIKELDNDPDKYLAMLRENPMQPDFDFNWQEKLEKWLVNIIEKGNKPFNKDPRGWNNHPLRVRIKEMENKVKKYSNEKISLQISNKNLLQENHFYKKYAKGNFLCRHKFKNGFVKTYVLGIRINKRKIKEF